MQLLDLERDEKYFIVDLEEENKQYQVEVDQAFSNLRLEPFPARPGLQNPLLIELNQQEVLRLIQANVSSYELGKVLDQKVEQLRNYTPFYSF
jgi:hypothetical protein